MNNRDNIYFWHCAPLSHQAAVASLLHFTARDYMLRAKDSAVIRSLLF